MAAPTIGGGDTLIQVRGLVVALGAEVRIRVAGWSLGAAEQVAITGPSGCGKTTFIHVLAALQPFVAGQVTVCGTDLAGLDEDGRDRLRAGPIALIPQGLHLLQGFTALQNVALGSAFAHGPITPPRAMLDAVGLGHRLYHRPADLSLGEQQRVAIARALAKRPRLLLADEPTASLDARRAREVIALLRGLCARDGCALILVCHQPELVAGFERREDFVDVGGGP